MGRTFMIGTSVLATVLFIINFELAAADHWAAWAIPGFLILLVILNYLRFTRFVSWVIFGTAFFGFLVLLSAFTLRWRNEPSFNPMPFYRAIIMYVAFIYVSLAQIKILGSVQHPGLSISNKPEELK